MRGRLAQNRFTFSSVSFRIVVKEAKNSGVSDPRNTTLMKMFNLINVGERAGSGIPSIYSVWKKQGWSEPVLREEYAPDRITLSLVFEKAAIKTSGKITAIHKEAIINYLTEYGSATSVELADILNLKQARVREILTELIADGYVVAMGQNKNRKYQLKV